MCLLSPEWWVRGYSSPDTVRVTWAWVEGNPVDGTSLSSLSFYPERTQQQRGPHRGGEWDLLPTWMYWMAAGGKEQQGSMGRNSPVGKGESGLGSGL